MVPRRLEDDRTGPPRGGRCALITDFFQNGDIVTLHRLANGDPEPLEEQLREHTQKRPVALVIPCLAEELERPALARIVDTLAHVDYIHQVVIALGRAGADEFEQALEYFAPIERGGAQVRVLWNEGPRLQRIYETLEAHGFEAPQQGKGRATWAALGYLLADGQASVVALHDADILHYQRDMLARLVHPVVRPGNGISVSKGYYARLSDRMHGRVTRLFFTPLVRSMRRILPEEELLGHLDTYRYPLSGEFAMDLQLAGRMRIPGDWGLEVGMLAEIHRQLRCNQIAQVDIADSYDHKHQDLSRDDPEAGLAKMAKEVTRTLVANLSARQEILDRATVSELQDLYLETALEYIRRYQQVAEINGLDYDREAEEEAVTVFVRSLGSALHQAAVNADVTPARIPEWDEITRVLPSLLEEFHKAVEADNATKRLVADQAIVSPR